MEGLNLLLLAGWVLAQVLVQLASGTLKHSSLYVGTSPRCLVNKLGSPLFLI